MEMLIILFLCIVASSKVTIQSLFAKKSVKTMEDGLVFNGIIFLFAAIAFCKNTIHSSEQSFLFGFLFGILTVIFQLCYINALSCGNVSLTVMIVNFSMIIPITISIVIYRETLSVAGLIGIMLTFIALALNKKGTVEKTGFKKWLIFSAVASLANGGIGVVQKIFGKTIGNSEKEAFVAWGYIVAATLSFIIYLILYATNRKITFKMSGKIFLFGGLAGILLGIFQVANTAAMSKIAGPIFFPSYNGGTLLLSIAISTWLFKEKMSNQQKVSAVVGVIAIIFMSI